MEVPRWLSGDHRLSLLPTMVSTSPSRRLSASTAWASSRRPRCVSQRGVRDEEHADRVRDAAYRADAEHPTPVAGYTFEAEIGDVGEQDSEGDHELVQRHCAATDACRGVFGDVHRGDERRGAHREAQHRAGRDQLPDVVRERRSERGEGVDDPGVELGPLWTERVGEVAGENGPRHGPEQQAPHDPGKIQRWQPHVHVVLGRRDGTTRGRHLRAATVRPTLEVMVTESPRSLRRRFDPDAGLALIDPEASP